MEWREYGTLLCSSSRKRFWTSLQIWLKKPHVISRRLCGSKTISSKEISLNKDIIHKIITGEINICENDIRSKLCDPVLITVEDGLNSITNTLKKEVEIDVHKTLGQTLLVRDLLPKRIDRCKTLRELVVLDEEAGSAVFIPVGEYATDSNYDAPKALSYALVYKDYMVTIYIKGNTEPIAGMTLGCTPAWLQDTLLIKLIEWAKEKDLDTEPRSLTLISVQRYNDVYQCLKQKYGLKLVKEWPESTDPQKFVFEDVAIAAYLMCIWEKERESLNLTEKQSFVDLGCGNGLLVYLLMAEGYRGLGIDVRKRKIWDMFSEVANLKEQSITPSDEHLFPEYDWLIGNHSDELTPWIPVIAARSSYRCRFFVLPCCPYDFDCKFSRKVHGYSQYQSYLQYVREIGEVCGFEVRQDTLRIPSTKRSSLLGMTRTYGLNEGPSVSKNITSFIKERTTKSEADVQSAKVIKLDSKQLLSDSENIAWADNFTARPLETPKAGLFLAVNAELKENITSTVVKALLTTKNVVHQKLDDGRSWNAGGSIPLGEVASLLGQDVLSRLKSECGGLQALLRTCNHIFKVQGGSVTLRNWASQDEYNRVNEKMKKGKRKRKNASHDPSKFYKTQICWFNAHHPDGCPRKADMCCFAHGQNELRPPTLKIF